MNSPLNHTGLLIYQPEYGAGLLSSLKSINLKDLPATPSCLAPQICLPWKPTYPVPEWTKICLPEVPDLWFPTHIPHSLQDLTCLYFMVTAATAASDCYLSSSSLLYSRSSCLSAWSAQPTPILNSYLWCPSAVFLTACVLQQCPNRSQENETSKSSSVGDTELFKLLKMGRWSAICPWVYLGDW